MAQLIVYGIKNCDTMKKTFAFLDKKKADYVFHDYKKSGVERAVLEAAMARFGWENVINRKGTSWRKLPETAREKMTARSALAAALETPSLIKRPLLLKGKKMALGFDADSLLDFLG